MKKPAVILFSFFIFSSVFAQIHRIDSLKLLLEKEKTDTSRVWLLADLSFALFESKPDTAMILALQGLELSRKIGFEKGEARSLNMIGNAYYVLGNYSKALTMYLQSLKINEDIGNLDGEQGSLGNIGLVYEAQGDQRLALRYTFQSLKIAQQLETTLRTAIILDNIGRYYLDLKLYDSAALFEQQALVTANKINYDRIIGSSNSGLGQIHLRMDQYQLAISYCELSFYSLKKAEDYLELTASYLTTASAFDKLNQKDSALFYAKQAVSIAKERGFTLQLRDAAGFLSFFYRKRNADSAFFYEDVSRICNDSLFSQQKQQQINSLAFDEKMRQHELEAKKMKEAEERKNNLQYVAIALGLLSFLIIFLLFSHSIIANQKLIRFLGVIVLLIVFEFLNLFLHPFLTEFTHHSPVLMLLIMVCIATLLVPLHHRLEHWITHRLVEKNNRIRLAAAKKTIASIEKNRNE